MDRGDWQTAVQGVTKSQNQLSMHAYIHTYIGRGLILHPAVDMVGWEQQEIIAMET